MKGVDTLNKEVSSKGLRRIPSIRNGCEASMRIKLNDEKLYEIYYFKEAHNHGFVDEQDRHFLSAARSLNHVQQEAIKALGQINVGPVRAFNIMRTLYGGFDKVGATKTDFKNFKRDLNLYVSEFDADMMIKRFNKKKEYLKNFTFEFITSEEGVLQGVFWADEQAKRNFHMFGDVVSFDSTYRRNKYNMMFVPFTGIDNHNRNVTLGAAIIGNETAETYKWLLNVAKKAFGRAPPPVIVTDQDPVMKKAIEEACPESRHRLCMWHVMDKLSGKVGAVLCNTTDFKSRLCLIVWTDNLLPEEFEKEWAAILRDFNLIDHEWLDSIYQIKDSWIPAYYRHERMSGLMRTSSRSESENHFFGQFCNHSCTLVQFIGHFDLAIEAQRHEHRKNDHDTRNTFPDILSDFQLERQAAHIYTRTIFFDVQLEIEAAIHSCASAKFEKVGDFLKFYVKDFQQLCTSFYEVMFRKEDMTVYCNCNRLGDIGEYPKQYILTRWTREAVPNNEPGAIISQDDEDVHSDDINRVVREITYGMETVVTKLVSKFEVLCSFRDHINQFIPKADEAQIDAPRKSRRYRFAELTGESQPSTITVRVPIGTRFKGMGKPKRMKSKRKQVKSQAGSKQRQCHNCLQYGHNIRTCKLPKKVVANDESSKTDEEDQEEHEPESEE